MIGVDVAQFWFVSSGSALFAPCGQSTLSWLPNNAGSNIFVVVHFIMGNIFIRQFDSLRIEDNHLFFLVN